MNQDTLINWLYNHFNAEEFLQAKQRGGAFAYLAGVSQQILGQTGNNPQPRATGRVRAPATGTMDAEDAELNPPPQRLQLRANPAPAAQDLNATNEGATPAPAAAPRRQAARATVNDGDRVRVATL